MTREETWNGHRPFSITGWHFELLKTAGPVDVKIYRAGTLIASATDIEAGYEYRVPATLRPFDRIEITTDASEAVKFAFSDGAESYKPRALWYDRNPIARLSTYGASGVAPHALTTRWTYTVPTGKKYYCQFSTVAVLRVTAATVAALARAAIEYDLGGAGSTVGSLNVADTFSNAVDGGREFTAGSSGVFVAGDIVRGQTVDNSTDGTMLLRSIMQGIEFNA